ncbi:MAG TPA: hypothetical protein VHA56_21670 [Mucilaginibacter sp.]|nr:hypothetical protein [Mucilaginibacter sp.]
MTATEETKQPVKAARRTYRCPKCNSELTDRAHRSLLVKTFLFWMPVKRFYCHACKRRPYIMGE